MCKLPGSLSVLFVLGLAVSLASAEEPAAPKPMRDADAVRIAEAFRLANSIGNRLWPDWDKSPFPVLLVTKEHEYLIRHPKPTDDFTLVGTNSTLNEKVWSRKRQFNPSFLATFPAVGGIPTVVIGQPENTTAKKSTHWVVTLLHEHFHQLQYSQEGYQAGVNELGLGRGDQTGMWMLNYPFPYAANDVKVQFSLMCQSLREAVRARDQADFGAKLASYLDAKRKFRALLKPDDYKYISFQIWQEGIARYTEYHLAELAASHFEPSKEFQQLNDFVPFKDEARSVLAGIENELVALHLDKAKRETFYALGAAEGLLLDRANPGWRRRYFQERFSLDKHFPNRK
jgi:hypothetical protein